MDCTHFRRDDQIELDAHDVLIACNLASDMDGRNDPGNAVRTLAQWVATIRRDAPKKA